MTAETREVALSRGEVRAVGELPSFPPSVTWTNKTLLSGSRMDGLNCTTTPLGVQPLYDKVLCTAAVRNNYRHFWILYSKGIEGNTSTFRSCMYNASSMVFQALVSFKRVSQFLELEEIEVCDSDKDLCISGEHK